ncbi:MAG: SDR family oxidoreductase [Chloroflexi bacterium]|nr:SDR family oxidoreductase [Chloroflexota bacterium]
MELAEFSITGKTAVVTGASRGIGQGIALTLAEAGVDLCIAARSKQELESLAAEIQKLGRKCLVAVTDVSKQEDIERMAKTALAGLGRVDILVNNAGAMVPKPLVPIPGFNPPTGDDLPGFFEPMSNQEWHRVMDVNLTAAMMAMRAFGPHFLERKQGRVINITSVNAAKSARFRVSYDASKAALAAFTRSMAVEWARHNITVNAIGPGYVETELTKSQLQDERMGKRILSEIPMRRLGTAREMGLLAVFLASPAAAYITGQTVYIDGGYLA